MSGMHDGAPSIDPLDALRAADHRPVHEVWRERILSSFRSGLRETVQRTAVVVGLVAFAVAIGWRLFVASDPPVEDSLPFAQPSETSAQVPEPAAPSEVQVAAQSSAESPANETIVVHVAGSVLNPGLVIGRSGWRVDDAVNAAGGSVGVADLDRLNLAAPIQDGQRIFVPTIGEGEPAVLGPQGATGGGPEASGPVDLNTADAPALESLPGVGPATAATIIAHRQEHGAFGDVDALVAVRGIGPATLETLRDHVTVG